MYKDLSESRMVRVEITKPGIMVRYNIRPVAFVANKNGIYISDIDQELDIDLNGYAAEEIGDGEYIFTSGDTEIYLGAIPLTLAG